MKFCRYFMLFLLVAALLPVNVLAVAETDESIIRYSDGSYTVVTMDTIEARAAGKRIGTNEVKHYNIRGELQWIATLTGYFTYDGTSSTCTYSSVGVDVISNDWYIISGLSRENGSTATAEVIMGNKVLGVEARKTLNLSVSCDPNGNLR